MYIGELNSYYYSQEVTPLTLVKYLLYLKRNSPGSVNCIFDELFSKDVIIWLVLT